MALTPVLCPDRRRNVPDRVESMPCSLSTKTQPDSRGLVPAIHNTRDLLVKIAPFGVGAEDQPHFPAARPMLHIVLALDRRANCLVALEIYQPRQPIALCEAADHPRPMLETAVDKIAGHTGVESPVRPVAHHVNPAASAHVNVLLLRHDHYLDGRGRAPAVRSREFIGG